ncbi:MAG: hypothetical protein ACYCYP_10935 [Leptospirales bacterium]
MMVTQPDDRTPDRWLKVRIRIPTEVLEAPELVQRLKHVKSGATYGDFVIARKGQPEIGESEFHRLWNRLPPHPHDREEWIPFRPSWSDESGRTYQVLSEEPSSIRLVREDGVMGHCSHDEFGRFFRPIGGSGSSPMQQG